MIFAVLGLVFATFITLLLLIRYAKSRENYVRDLFLPAAEGEPSEFARTISGITDVLYERYKQSAAATLMGEDGHIKRQERELIKDAFSEGIDNDWIKVIWEQLPAKWQNRIMKNPTAAVAAYNLMTKGGGAPFAPGSTDHPGNGKSDIIERLKIAQ